MSDANLSLPVRTQNNGDVVIELADGTTPSQKAAVSSSGSLQVAGQGTAGTPAGGVLTVQGIVGGTSIPVSSASDVFPATQSITTQDLVSTSTTYYNNQTWYSGTPTSGSAASFSLSSYETGMLEVTGTWTGTLQVEISNDGGTNWIAHAIHQIGSAAFISNFTNNVTGSLNLAGKTNVRVRATAAMTGTATIKFIFSANPSSVYVANALKLVDGSSTTSTTQMNILAASTAASTSNTAVVVALSPNTPLPSGSNVIGALTANQSVNLTQVAGTSLSLGQKTMSASLPVAIASDQSTINVKDGADGPVTPGTAASNSILSGGVYTSAGITLTTGQQAALQLDSAGRLLVDGSQVTQPVSGSVSLTGTSAVNLTQVGGSAVALGQTTMSASIPVTLASNQSALSTTNASVGTTGTTAPTSATEIGALVASSAPTLTSGNLASLSLTTAGALRVDGSSVTQPVSGTVTASQGGAPWSQNLTQISGATPSATNALPTQLATAGAYVSSSNPLPVILDPAGAGTFQYYYTDASSVAVGSTATNSTTVGGTTGFYITQVYVAGSGKFKALIQTETAAGSGTFTTRFVTFNSTAIPYAQITFPQPLLVATGARVQVLMTNNDLLAQDLYSTVTGYQI